MSFCSELLLVIDIDVVAKFGMSSLNHTLPHNSSITVFDSILSCCVSNTTSFEVIAGSSSLFAVVNKLKQETNWSKRCHDILIAGEVSNFQFACY